MDDKSNNSISDVDEESSDSSNESSEDGSNSEEEDVEDNDEEDDCVAAGGDSFVNNDDEDEENTPLGLDSIVKVTNTSVAMRKSPVNVSFEGEEYTFFVIFLNTDSIGGRLKEALNSS